MKKNIYLVTLLFVGGFVSKGVAQECGTDCFFLVNKTISNPGYHIVDTVNRLRLRKSPDYVGFVRYQRSFIDSGISYNMSLVGGNYRFSNNGAVGVHVLSENQGIFSFVDIEANYSTVARISKDWRLAVTASTGIFRQDINKSSLSEKDLADPLIFQNVSNFNGFKMGGGIVVTYKRQYKLSFYSPYIVKPRRPTLSNISAIASVKMKGGPLKYEPTLMYTYINGLNDSFRVGVEVYYKDKIGFVPSYESNGDIGFATVFNLSKTRIIIQYKIGTVKYGGGSYQVGGDIVGDKERLNFMKGPVKKNY